MVHFPVHCNYSLSFPDSHPFHIPCNMHSIGQILQINLGHRIDGIAQKERRVHPGNNWEISTTTVKFAFAATAEVFICGRHQPEVYMSIATYCDTTCAQWCASSVSMWLLSFSLDHTFQLNLSSEHTRWMEMYHHLLRDRKWSKQNLRPPSGYIS